MNTQLFVLIILVFSGQLFAVPAPMVTFPYSNKTVSSYAQSYDLYLPEQANSSTPLFAFVHGGYWVQDDRDYGFGKKIAEHLVTQGFAVALLRYRLAPKYKHPAQIKDISLGFSRLMQQLDSKAYSASCIIAAGHSAGGHLVSLMALDPQYLDKHQLKATQLNSVFGLSGVYDLNDASGEVNERIKQLYQSVFGVEKSMRFAASPLSYSRQPSPPMVLLAGSDDFKGFENDAKLFYQALLNAGKKDTEFKVLENRNHFHMVDTRFNEAELLRLIQSKVNCPLLINKV